MGRRCSNRAGCRTPRRSTVSSFSAGGSSVGGLFAGVVILCGLAACGTTDEASRQTLPPLVTTTTSTTTTTTVPTDETYTIQAGDSLIVIGKLLGHALAETTERYAHLADEAIADAAKRVFGSLATSLGSAE